MSTHNDTEDAADTIAAIATAPGEAGIAIIRLSGPEALRIADDLFTGSSRPSQAPARTVLYGGIRASVEAGGMIDEVILLIFRAPHSYTREDLVEIQGHGGRIPAQRILRAALENGARLAEPGEFTRRAFLNGRIDLVQSEAVADLIRAQSDRAASAAIDQLNGSLSCFITSIYDYSLNIVADLEATMDFAEDELPSAVLVDIGNRLREARSRVDELLRTWDEGHLLREGARVVIAGEPNVGKSTLMNRLLGRDRSIVTAIPGTTRDTIEESLILNGIPIRIVDTAGLRDAGCVVEKEGIRRAESAIQDADINVYVLDGSQAMSDHDRQRLSILQPGRALVVINKADLGVRLDTSQIPQALGAVTVCLLEPEAADRVKACLADLLRERDSPLPHAAISERHRSALQMALSEMDHALAVMERRDVDGHLLAAEHLRAVLLSMGTITGREYSDELLDSIFSRFCIGK